MRDIDIIRMFQTMTEAIETLSAQIQAIKLKLEQIHNLKKDSDES